MIHDELLPAIGQIYCEQSMSTRRPIIIRERLDNNFKRHQEEEILDNQPLLDYDSNFAMS